MGCLYRIPLIHNQRQKANLIQKNTKIFIFFKSLKDKNEFCSYNWEAPMLRPGADAIKKFTPSLGIPYLGV